MNSLWIHPGAILLAGAALLPLIPRAPQKGPCC